MEAGISNFTDTTKSKIINGGLFRSISSGGGGGGGGGTTSPGGSTHQIQYNDTGVFNGSANLTFDTTTFALTGTMNVSGNVNISNGTLSGSTARMTVITGSSITGSTGIIQTITSSQEAIYTTSDMGSFTAGGIAATAKTGSISAQALDATGLFFHPSGTYMYAIDSLTDKVYEYSLSPSWDVSTISYTSVTASVTSQESSPQDIFFHPSGTYFYAIGTSGDDINQYSMSPAWSLGSSTFFASSSANGFETNPLAFYFKPDGTSVYIAGTSSVIRQHTLTTPWDITTLVTSSVVSSFSVASIFIPVSGLSFSSDGKKMYVVTSETGSRILYEFLLSTAWDVSTATKYVSHNIGNANNTMTSTSIISALYIRPDGNNVYFINSAVDRVLQYNTKNASLSIGDGVLQVNDGMTVFNTSSFFDVTVNNLRASAITTIAGFAAGTTITAGTTISASSTISAGGAITGAAGMSISGGPTTIAGGAGQNLTVSTSLQVTGPTPTFSNAITASGGITGSIAKFDTVIGKYATYTANFNVPTASYFFGISTTGSVVTASLTGAASYYAGQTLVFKDIAGSASLNNIYIRPSGSETIDGGSGALITTPSGSLTIVSNGTNGFYIIGMV
jgi:sugar lactone lactonase YvrE